MQRQVDSLQGQEVRINEITQNVTKSGERIWIAWSNRVIKSGEGREKELLCVGNDITEEVRHKKELEDLIGELEKAKEEVLQREEQFRTLIEAIPDALIISDQDGRIRLVNAQTERLFGYRREELVRQSVELLVPERFRAEHPSLRQRYYRAPSLCAVGVGQVLTAVGKDGGEFAVEIGLSPLPDPDGGGMLVCSSLRDIRELRRLEQEVVVSEERSRLILESTSEGIFGVDRSGAITFVNPAAARLLGYSPEELIGQSSHALIHHRRADGTPYPVGECPMHAAYTRGEASRIDDELLCRKDGHGLPVEYGATPIFKDGTLVGAVISFTDITERKRAEAELERRRDELQHINFLADSALELTKAGYWHVPLDGSGWYNSSERAAQIFGDPPTPDHRYTLAHWAEHVRLGDEAAAKVTADNFAAAAAGKTPVHDAMYAYKRPVDGRVVWIHALGHVVKDENGKPRDMYGVTQDITEQKLAEDRARDDAAFLQALVDTIPYPVFYKAPDTRFLGCNRAYESAFGVGRQDVIGKRVAELDYLPEADRLAFQAEDEAIITAVGSVEKEIAIPMADGRVHDALYYVSGFRKADGSPGGLIGTLVDVSDRKKVEEIERFNRLALGREQRIIELKQQINALAAELGRGSPFPSVEQGESTAIEVIRVEQPPAVLDDATVKSTVHRTGAGERAAAIVRGLLRGGGRRLGHH